MANDKGWATQLTQPVRENVFGRKSLTRNCIGSTPRQGWFGVVTARCFGMGKQAYLGQLLSLGVPPGRLTLRLWHTTELATVRPKKRSQVVTARGQSRR